MYGNDISIKIVTIDFFIIYFYGTINFLSSAFIFSNGGERAHSHALRVHRLYLLHLCGKTFDLHLYVPLQLDAVACCVCLPYFKTLRQTDSFLDSGRPQGGSLDGFHSSLHHVRLHAVNRD